MTPTAPFAVHVVATKRPTTATIQRKAMLAQSAPQTKGAAFGYTVRQFVTFCFRCVMHPLPSVSAPSFAHAQFDASKRLASWAACFVTLALAACGGGGGGGGSPATTGAAPQGQDLAAGNYLPLQVGNRWLYQSSDSSTPVTVRLTATATVDGLSGTVEHSDDPNDSSSSILVADAQGVRQFPAADADALTAAVGPVQLLRYPLSVGDTFVASDKSVGAVEDIDGDGVADAATVHADTKVVAVEQVTTPAGTFADCIHLQTTATVVVQSSALKQSITISNVEDDWLAPGIGPVRTVSVTTGNGTSASTTQSITAYGVGAKRSESVAPTATAPGLTGTAPLGPNAAIDIAFSEDMDTTTLAGAFKVVDAAGEPVAGVATVGARNLHFVPSAPWFTGAYTAGFIDAATDLVGNPIGGTASWSFTIDATPPTVIQSQPLEGAIDVPFASSIVLTFSEAVDPTTASRSTIFLTLNGAPDFTPFSLGTNGTVVTITPDQPLMRGTGYRLRLQGVSDLAGNLAVPTTIDFRTDPGRFAAGQRLVADSDASAQYGAPIVAIGDLNGDGLLDVASAAQYVAGNGGVEARVVMMLQRADGTLSPAVTLSTTADFCIPAALAVADIDGDGRNELLISRSTIAPTCKSMLMRIAADGSFATDLVEPPIHGRVKSADLDGDGRSEIITYFDGEPSTRIWRLDASGWTLLDTLTVDATAVTVGDLDRDGRPDIALVPNGGSPTAAELWLQGANGHFAFQQALHTARDGYDPSSVSIADLDGDGRNDLVIGNMDNIYVFKSTGAGSFSAATPLINAPSYLTTPAIAVDVNGDGRPDIVYADGGSILNVMLQQSDGSFGATANYPSSDGFQPRVDALIVSDLNRDGRPDVILNGRLYLQRAVSATSASVRPSKRARGSLLRRVSGAVRRQ